MPWIAELLKSVKHYMLEKSIQGILFSCKAANILIINLSSSDTYYIKIYISYKEHQELNIRLIPIL